MNTYTCENCGRVFQDYASNRTKGEVHCCSRKCKAEYQTKLAKIIAPKKINSVCRACGKTKNISEFYKDNGSIANGGIQYDCKECIKKKRQQYYDANIEVVNDRVTKYHKDHPGRSNKAQKTNPAHYALNYAVSKGEIKKPSRCELCGKTGRLHAHHWHGYEHPLDVQWLCPSCHHAAHGRGPKARGAL
jgi:hypothetical protein